MDLKEFFGSTPTTIDPLDAPLPKPKSLVVAEASEAKKALLADYSNYQNLSQGQILQQQEQVRAAGENGRTGAELGQDFGKSIVRTAVNLVGGTANLAYGIGQKAGPGAGMQDALESGVFGDGIKKRAIESRVKANRGITGALSKVDEMLAGAMTDASQINEQIVGAKIQEAQDRNLETYNENMAEPGPMGMAKNVLETSKRVGKDLWAGFSETIENPTVLSNTVVGQAPTLFIGAGAKAATTVDAVAARAALIAERRAYGGLATARVTKQITEEAKEQLLKRNLALGVGGSEGGGAYQQAVDQVMSSDIHALAFTNPEIAERLEAGEDPELVQLDYAQQRGFIAAGIVAPVAGAVSKLAANFELAPLSSSALRPAAATAARRVGGNAMNVAQETVEETLQSGVGALAGNAAATLSGEDGVDLFDGVGAAAGQGAAGGFGMAAAFQTPGTIANGTRAAGSAAYNYLRQTAAQHDAAADANQVRQAEVERNARTEDANTLSTGFQAGTPGSVRAAEAAVSDEILTPEVAGILQGEDGTPVDRVTALSRAHNAMSVPGAVSPENAPNMMAFAAKTARQLRADMQTIEDPALKEAALRLVESPLARQLEDMIKNAPPEVIADAFAKVPSNIADGYEMDADTISALETIREISMISPDKVTPEQADKAIPLFQARGDSEGVTQMTLAKELAAIKENHVKGMASIEAKTKFKSPDIVTSEIVDDGFVLAKTQLKSVTQHVSDVSMAFADGDMDRAEQQMKRLLGFAQGLTNKATAFDEAAKQQKDARGTDLEDSWFEVAGTRRLNSEQSLGTKKNRINLKVGASVGLIDAVFADANTVAAAYNTLAQTYPQILSYSGSSKTPLPASLTVESKPTYRSYTPAPKVEDAPASDVPAAVDSPVVDEAPAVATAPEVVVATPVEDVAPAPVAEETPAPAPVVAERSGVKTVYATTKAGTFRLTDELAPAGSDFSEFGEVRIIEAFDGDQKIGELLYANDGTPPTVNVEEGFQRRGVATAMYKLAREQGGVLGDAREGIRSNGKEYRTEQGQAFRENANEDSVSLSDQAPVVEEATAEEAVAPEPTTVAERFPGLQTEHAGMPNKLATGFRLSKKSRGLFARFNDGITAVMDAIREAIETGNPDAMLSAYVPEHQNMGVDELQVSAMRELIGAFVPQVVENLNRALQNRATGKDNEGKQSFNNSGTASGFSARLLKGEKTWQYANRLSLHGAQWAQNEKGEFEISYQPKVAEAMALAVLEWALDSVNNPIIPNWEKLSKLHPEGITPALMEAYTTAHPTTSPVATIAQSLQAVLGVNPDTGLSNTYASGIMTALAQDALQGLALTGAVEIFAVDGTQGVSKTVKGKSVPQLRRDGSQIMKQIYFLRLNQDNNSNDWRNGRDTLSLKPVRDRLKGMALVKRLLNPDNQELPTFGAPSTNVPTHQTGTRQKLSDKLRNAIRAANKIKFYPNQPLMVMQEALGEENFLQLLEFNNQDLAALNEGHRRTVEGKNLSLTYALDNLREIFTLWQGEAEARGVNMGDVPAYFSRRIISNGRMMMNGFGPQSDKIAREMVSAVRDVLNLRDDPTHMLAYQLTLAQALGVKTEILKNSMSTQTIAQEMEHPVYQALFSDLNDLSNNPENAELADAVTRQIAAIQNGSAGVRKIPKTARALHALMGHARYLAAKEAGTENEFTSYLAFELDGKTNGPFNAISHFGMWDLNEKRISQLAKGGWFINVQGPKTLSDVGTTVGDMYQDTADKLQKAILFELNQPVAGNDKVGFAKRKALEASIDLFSRIGHMKTSVVDGATKLDVMRGVAKGALMTTTYGSGRATVVGVLAMEIMEHVNEQLSLALEGEGSLDPKLQASLQTLMRSYKNVDGDWVRAPTLNLNNRATYRQGPFHPLHMKALVDGLTQSAGGTLVDIIDMELAPVLDTFKLLYKTSGFQSWALRRDFNTAYEKIRAEKVASGELEATDTLSRADEAAIMESLAAKVPAYRTLLTAGAAEQEGINVTEKDYGGEVEVEGGVAEARSILGELGRAINVTSITNPGVRAAALLTIASGDATMMSLLQLMDPDGTLDVYDGWEVGPLSIKKRALQANDAVRQTLDFDVLGSVNENFQSFELDVAALSNEEVVDLARFTRQQGALELTPGNDKEVEEMRATLIESIDGTRAQLDYRSKLTQINKQILRETPNSVDQMSGGEVPHMNDAPYRENLIEYIEGRQAEELAKLKPDETLDGESELGKRLAESLKEGLTSLDLTDVELMLSNFPYASKVHKFVMSQIMSLLPDDLQVHFGTESQIRAKQQELFPGVDFGTDGNVGAFYQNAVFLKNTSEETLMHELVHAATYNMVRGFYAGGVNLSPNQKDAVRELEVLMNSFVANNTTVLTTAEGEAFWDAKSAILSHLRAERPAEALNEFMAWTMTNPAITGALSKMPAPSGLKGLAQKVLTLVRKVLGLPNNPAMVSFLEASLGNLHRLVRRAVDTSDVPEGMQLFQSLGNGRPTRHNDRLVELAEQFEWMRNNIPRDGTDEALTLRDASEAVLAANEIRERFVDAGFVFTAQEQYLFEQVQALMASTIQLDPGSVAMMQDVYNSVIDQLTPDDFAVPGSNEAENQSRYNAVLGVGNRTEDKMQRSNLLANFMALALVNDQLRTKMEGMQVRTTRGKVEGLDAQVRDVTTRVFDYFSSAELLRGKARNQRQLMDMLTERLVRNQKAAVKRSQKGPDLMQQAEAKVKGQMAKWGDRAEAKLAEREAAGLQGGTEGWINGLLMGIRSFGSDQGAAAFAEGALQSINEMGAPKVVSELLAELVGVTDSNAPIAQLLNRTKHMVSRVRQRLRDEAPDQVKGLFKTPLTDRVWADLHTAVGKTDLQALQGAYTGQEIERLLSDPAALAAAISSVESQLGPNEAAYRRAALDTGTYLATGQNISQGFLYRNADAMARLLGSPQAVAEASVPTLVPLLDRLITLRALSRLTDAQRSTAADLFRTEPEGMASLMRLLGGLATAEGGKPGAGSQSFNRWKGYVPVSQDPRSQLVLANGSRGAELAKLGYRRVGNYVGDPADGGAAGLAYWAVDWSGGAETYNQGAMQTVEGTVQGVDRFTGRTLDPAVKTMISDDTTVAAITRAKQARTSAIIGTNLSPIFNEDGTVAGYERILDQALVKQHLRQTHDLANSVGVWMGRQAEEEIARVMNRRVVEAIKKQWDEGKGFRAGEYVAIDRTNVATIAEAWQAIPRETQNMLTEIFEDGPVMVRKDMVNNAIGYRSASVANVFTGVSDLSDQTKKVLRDVAYGTLGPNAYQRLLVAEKTWKALVGNAKDWIVVRSGVVALANAFANQFQLLQHGVPLTRLLQSQAAKVRETELYLRHEKRLAQITFELNRVTAPGELARLEREKTMLQDAVSRLSIYPLIEAGELPTIAEGLNEQDEFNLLADGMKWIQKKAEGAPSQLNTAARYAFIAKDTALYQGLNRMIQFGDFMAKGVLYDQMVADGKTKAEALQAVNESFVNYNLLAGRTRDYAESMGLTWFLNYKIRIQKIILRTLRENPLRFIMAGAGAEAIGADSLLSGNAVAQNWSYAMGPGQFFRAHDMLMWQQLVD